LAEAAAPISTLMLCHVRKSRVCDLISRFRDRTGEVVVMNRSIPLIALAALSVAACKKWAEEAHTPAPKPPAAAASDANAASAAHAGADDSQAAENVATPQAPMLAMAYKLGLVVPAEKVRPLMESHQEACERAGSDQCQVLSANAEAEQGDRASADLTLRATPAWMRLFRDRAEADAKDLGGKVEEAATEGDDLSRQIVDTDAAQAARAAERTRLAELMQRRTKSLGDTLQVEQEITRVQGEMDQASSELAAMTDRVAMETVSVHYASPAMISPEGEAAPLQAAARGFMGNVFAMLAALVTLASFLLPLGLVAAPIVWLIARRKKAPADPSGTTGQALANE
jgi:hypothetical protein